MRGKNLYGAYVRPTSAKKTEEKRKKAQAARIKKAQALLKQAFNQIKGILGHEELDMAKYGIQYSHSQMSAVTKWLDGSEKDPLEPVESNSIDVEIQDCDRPRSLIQRPAPGCERPVLQSGAPV